MYLVNFPDWVYKKKTSLCGLRSFTPEGGGRKVRTFVKIDDEIFQEGDGEFHHFLSEVDRWRSTLEISVRLKYPVDALRGVDLAGTDFFTASLSVGISRWREEEEMGDWIKMRRSFLSFKNLQEWVEKSYRPILSLIDVQGRNEQFPAVSRLLEVYKGDLEKLALQFAEERKQREALLTLPESQIYSGA